MAFDFKDLTYNAAAAPETTKTKAGDPIRDSSYDYLYSAVTMAYAKNRLPGLYPGIIVSVRAANNMSPIAANKAVVPGIPTSAVEGELVGWEGFDDTFESLNIYKVVNIILNPLPYPISYRDPILLHYPDFDAVNATQALPIGMLVQLDYHSDDHLKGGRIVQEGPVIDLGWGDMTGMMMSLQDIWSQNEPKPIERSAIVQLLDGTPRAEEGQVIESSAPPNPGTIRTTVNAEVSHWDGKVETDTEVAPRLKAYWDNLAQTQSPSVPWSAAFISYVMNQVDPEFPKSFSHYDYAVSAKRKKGGWSLFQTSGAGKIKAQVGDIFVKLRDDPKNPKATHGDVVYKIDPGTPGTSNTAFLAGGNIGDTLKTNITLSVDASGYYNNLGAYIVVLKKAGRIVSTGTTT